MLLLIFSFNVNINMYGAGGGKGAGLPGGPPDARVRRRDYRRRVRAVGGRMLRGERGDRRRRATAELRRTGRTGRDGGARVGACGRPQREPGRSRHGQHRRIRGVPLRRLRHRRGRCAGEHLCLGGRAALDPGPCRCGDSSHRVADSGPPLRGRSRGPCAGPPVVRRRGAVRSRVPLPALRGRAGRWGGGAVVHPMGGLPPRRRCGTRPGVRRARARRCVPSIRP